MFKGLVRDKYKLSEECAYAILERTEYGVLSTLSNNGYCYGVPVNHVVHKNNIYFHCAMNDGLKIENVQSHNKVSYTVVDNVQLLPSKMDTRYESVIVFGKASIVEEVEEKKLALNLLVKRFSPELWKEKMPCVENGPARTNIVRINIEHIVGKSSYLEDN